MNTFGTRSVKVAAVLATAAGAIIGGVAHTSAGAPTQWYAANDGCYYLSDDGGQTATTAACPDGNGYINVYAADAGQWYYSLTVVADGGVVQQSPVQQSGSYQIDASSWLAPMLSPSSTLTGNAVVDSYMTAVNNQIIDTWLQPTCVEVVGDTCYVS